ncbi:MAG TPA: hypothetical protein VFP32_01855 [Candidatus Saccharimonadales bacterium]|nr:hypothetical protein [Candidatus Saccharimonadales bacterium]
MPKEEFNQGRDSEAIEDSEARFRSAHDRQKLRADKEALYAYIEDVMRRYAAGEDVWKVGVGGEQTVYTLFSNYQRIGRLAERDDGAYDVFVAGTDGLHIYGDGGPLISGVDFLERLASSWRVQTETSSDTPSIPDFNWHSGLTSAN